MDTFTTSVVTRASFLALMAEFPTGVAVVTTTDARGRPRGMTCSSLCSVSLQPPTMLVCLRAGSPTLDAILVKHGFAINLLHTAGQHAAALFASARSDRFDHVRWQLDDAAAGPHLSEDAHAVADCRVSRALSIGDHAVVFGEVVRVSALSAGLPPLLYGQRRYATWPAL